MINKDGGGGTIFGFYGRHRAHGGSPIPPLGKTLNCQTNLEEAPCNSDAKERILHKTRTISSALPMLTA